MKAAPINNRAQINLAAIIQFISGMPDEVRDRSTACMGGWFAGMAMGLTITDRHPEAVGLVLRDLDYDNTTFAVDFDFTMIADAIAMGDTSVLED